MRRHRGHTRTLHARRSPTPAQDTFPFSILNVITTENNSPLFWGAFDDYFVLVAVVETRGIRLPSGPSGRPIVFSGAPTRSQGAK